VKIISRKWFAASLNKVVTLLGGIQIFSRLISRVFGLQESFHKISSHKSNLQKVSRIFEP
jgi:hypothetical protein